MSAQQDLSAPAGRSDQLAPAAPASSGAPIPPEASLPTPQPPRPDDPVTIAALEEVAAARQALADELVVLEASLRAAADIKAKVKRNPAKTAAVVGGTAFVALGGPRRTFRAVKHRVFGKPDPLPPSLLPKQVDQAVRALGDDGEKVRGALEREFASFVGGGVRAENRFRRRLVLATVAPLASRGIKLLFDRLEATNAEDIARREAAIRARVEGRPAPVGGASKPPAGSPPLSGSAASQPATGTRPPAG